MLGESGRIVLRTKVRGNVEQYKLYNSRYDAGYETQDFAEQPNSLTRLILGAFCRKYPCLTLFNLLSVCVYTTGAD